MNVDELLAALEGAAAGRFLEAGRPGPAGREEARAAREEARGRWRRLLEGFRRRAGGREVRLARAPGRVNLIGEHTDYNGLPVLPLAVDRDIAAVFATREDGQVGLESLQPEFAPRSFPLAARIPPYPTGDWGNYPKAGVQGMLDAFLPPAAGAAPSAARGFDALLEGDIPRAAGLSSSSALVVLSALMFLEANGLGVEKDGETAPGRVPGLRLAEQLARAEYYVGTQGGGMDQAASLLGRGGQALKIDFFPLRVQPVPLPAGCVFVVADSTVRAAKTEGAMDRYNRRSIECRLATAVLNRALAGSLAAPLGRLGDLAGSLPATDPAAVAGTAAGQLHERPYSLEEIARLLGLGAAETAERFCRRRDGSLFPPPSEGFKLRQRTRYVLEEGRRVEQALAALRAGDLAAMGALMDRSHEGGRDLYEISCPELDRLVETARAAGALGSRLTGAGFGGCTISLVREGDLPAFVERVERDFYRALPRPPAGPVPERIFPCRAVEGASVAPGF